MRNTLATLIFAAGLTGSLAAEMTAPSSPVQMAAVRGFAPNAVNGVGDGGHVFGAAANSYVASAVHFNNGTQLLPLAGSTTMASTFGPTTGSPYLLVASCTGASAGNSVIVPAASATAPVIGTVSTCTGNALTLGANSAKAAAGGSVVIFATSAVTLGTSSGSVALNGTSLTLASGLCPSGYAGMSVIDSNVPATPIIGTISACSGGVLTISAAAHAVAASDNIAVATLVSPTTTTPTQAAAGYTALLVNSCAGVVNGTTIIAQGAQSAAPRLLGAAARSGSNCVGSSAPYLLTMDSSGGGYLAAIAKPGDILSYATGIASADSCHMTFSGWRRQSTLWNYSPQPVTLTESWITAQGGPNAQSSENVAGIDIVQDGLGQRFVLGDHHANYNGMHNVVSNTAYMPFGTWTHVLWSANTCNTNTQYVQVYYNGVKQTLSTGDVAAATFDSGGIAFSDAGNPFSLGALDWGGGIYSFGDYADIELWTGFDIVCGSPGSSAAGCVGNNTISPTDLKRWIDSAGKPVDPAIRNAYYLSTLGSTIGKPTVQLTGPAASFVTNAGTGSAMSVLTPYPVQAGWGGVTDITTSPSCVSAYNPSGQCAANPLGYKWVCAVQAISLSFPGYACNNSYAVNDLIIVAFAGSWSSGPTTASCNDNTANGWTAITSLYNSSIGTIFCAYYKVMTSAAATNYGSPNANDFTGFGITATSAPSRGGDVVAIDYGRYNSGAAPSIDVPLPISASFTASTSITALATPPLANSNDLLVGIFASFTGNGYPFTCPAGMTKRVDPVFTSNAYGAQLFICDTQLTGNTTANQVATQTGSFGATGVLIPLYPN